MIGTLVDSSVLLDTLSRDPVWEKWSSEEIEKAVEAGPVYINPIICAEVSVGFDRIEDMNLAIPDSMFRRLHIPTEAAFLAGKAFRQYKSRGGTRTGTLPDFFIGAHAAVSGLKLLTRDANRFRSYFPTLELIAPTKDSGQ